MEKENFKKLVVRLAQHIEDNKWTLALSYAMQVAVSSGIPREEVVELIGEDAMDVIYNNADEFMNIAKEFSTNFNPNSSGLFE